MTVVIIRESKRGSEVTSKEANCGGGLTEDKVLFLSFTDLSPSVMSRYILILVVLHDFFNFKLISDVLLTLHIFCCLNLTFVSQR